MQTFISVEEARASILDAIEAIGREKVTITEATGRVLARPVTAPSDSPAFDNSSRDGFAFRWSDVDDDLPARLDVVGTVHAGDDVLPDIGPGQAVRIMTGARVPDGVDTVVMQEDCDFDEDLGTLTLGTLPDAGRGAWIRHAGDFMSAGDVVLEKGQRLGPAELSLVAGFGKTLLEVYRRPRVAIVSTGDELVDLDTPPGPAQIVNSNAYQLASLCEQAGAEPQMLPIAPDDPEAVRGAFRQALRSCDLVVSSGGVSVGARDFTRVVLDELTGGMSFWKIRMKPGKPLAFGKASGSGVPLIGLPGNPASCFVGFHQFVRPAIGLLQDRSVSEVEPRKLAAVLGADVSSTPRRREYLSGKVTFRDGEKPEFLPAPKQNSGNLALFCGATAFGLVEEGVSTMQAGDVIEIELLPE
ncbi:MAG: gephyrin-like molybdotransferase Glp [Myxococcota bacterium]